MYAEDALYYYPGESELFKGKQAIRDSYATGFRAFPDANVIFNTMFTSLGHLILEGISKGTFSAPMATPNSDVAPTGRSFEVKFAFIAKINSDGLIQEDPTLWITMR